MDKRVFALVAGGNPVGMIMVAEVDKITATLRFLGQKKPGGPMSRNAINRLMGVKAQESDFERKCRLFGLSPAAVRASRAAR